MKEENRVCLYCGKSLRGLFRESHRKYCSKLCSNRVAYKKAYPNRPYKLWVHEKNTFEAVMELHWNGEESGAIARRFNIPVGTIYSWIHDFGKQRQRKEPLKSLLYRAKNAEEWLAALRESTTSETFDDMPIHLVCGTYHGQSVKRFTNVIYERLNDNPLNGNVYAFCNKMRNTITTFAWKPPVFNISKNIKMHGTFLWPGEELGKSIEVTKGEFERLIFLHKQEIITERMSKNLESMRI